MIFTPRDISRNRDENGIVLPPFEIVGLQDLREYYQTELISAHAIVDFSNRTVVFLGRIVIGWLNEQDLNEQ